jgi:hypothetical protein
METPFQCSIDNSVVAGIQLTCQPTSAARAAATAPSTSARLRSSCEQAAWKLMWLWQSISSTSIDEEMGGDWGMYVHTYGFLSLCRVWATTDCSRTRSAEHDRPPHFSPVTYFSRTCSGHVTRKRAAASPAMPFRCTISCVT